MFSCYQEANKIANMMVLPLLLIYDIIFYPKEIQDQVLCTNIPEKCFLLLQ